MDEIQLINSQLADLYSAPLEAWKRLRIEQSGAHRCLSVPFLIKASQAYLDTSPRIVFVGQETHGWWDPCEREVEALTAPEIMDFYEREIAEPKRNYKRSPYWRALHQIASGFAQGGTAPSFLCANVLPCDLDKKRVPQDMQDTLLPWKLLPGELSLLKPDYVVFLCGWSYYAPLHAYFGSYPQGLVSTATPVVPYQVAGAAWKGYVTYHPNYLRRSGQWAQVQGIADSIKADWRAQRFCGDESELRFTPA